MAKSGTDAAHCCRQEMLRWPLYGGVSRDLLVPSSFFMKLNLRNIFYLILSIDLYLPALPKMAEVFSASEFLVNLTLAGFFLVFAVGII